MFRCSCLTMTLFFWTVPTEARNVFNTLGLTDPVFSVLVFQLLDRSAALHSYKPQVKWKHQESQRVSTAEGFEAASLFQSLILHKSPKYSADSLSSRKLQINKITGSPPFAAESSPPLRAPRSEQLCPAVRAHAPLSPDRLLFLESKRRGWAGGLGAGWA